jgi:hypothetical protein
MKVIIVRILISLEHFDCSSGLSTVIQKIIKLIIGELMTINLAVGSCLPHKTRNTSVDSMESSHELIDAKSATNTPNFPQI